MLNTYFSFNCNIIVFYDYGWLKDGHDQLKHDALLPIQEAVPSKAWDCGHKLGGITGLNPA